MTDGDAPLASPPGAPAGLPRGVQMLIMIGGGLVLAGGGCALALNTGLNTSLLVFGGVFCAGVLSFIGGIIGLFARKTSPLKLIGFAVLAMIALWIALVALGGGLLG